MNSNQVRHIHSWYQDYAAGFRQKDGKLPVTLQRKLEHSACVAEDCLNIARDLGWSESDVALAEAVGWLHDVGRFRQYTEYGTLRDALSVDHGELGSSILKESDVLADCTPLERTIIGEAVCHHNRREISSTIMPVALPFLKLVRDADKLDIYTVVEGMIKGNDQSAHPDMLLNISIDGPVNPVLLEEIKRGEDGSFSNIKSVADFQVVMISWVYGINYRQSLQRIQQRNLISRIAYNLPNDPAVQEVVQAALRYIGEY